MLTTAYHARPIPCWDCLKPAQEAIDGHPYWPLNIIRGKIPAKSRHFRRLRVWHCPQAPFVAEHSSENHASATRLARRSVHTRQNTAKRG